MSFILQDYWNQQVFKGWKESVEMWDKMEYNRDLYRLIKGEKTVIPIRMNQTSNKEKSDFRIVFFHANNYDALSASVDLHNALMTLTEKEKCKSDKTFPNIQIILPEYPCYHPFDPKIRTDTEYMVATDSIIDDWCGDLSAFLACNSDIPTYFVGHSIGTGFASRVACSYAVNHRIEMLLLLAPLISLQNRAEFKASTTSSMMLSFFFKKEYEYFPIFEMVRTLYRHSNMRKIVVASGSKDTYSSYAAHEFEYITHDGITVSNTGHNTIADTASLGLISEYICLDYDENFRVEGELGAGDAGGESGGNSD